MAEGRMLKRNVSDSRRLAELQSDSARLLWTWILPYLDVEGRFYADPVILKGKVVPRIKTITEANISSFLTEMERVGLIKIYEVDGEKYLQYRKFETYQSGLRKDREVVRIPKPPVSPTFSDNSKNCPANVGNVPGVPPEQSGNPPAESNLSQVNINQSKSSQDFIPLSKSITIIKGVFTEEVIGRFLNIYFKDCHDLGLALRILSEEFVKCIEYTKNKNIIVHDWRAFFRKWLNQIRLKNPERFEIASEKKLPKYELPPASECATPEEIHEEIEKAIKNLKSGGSE